MLNNYNDIVCDYCKANNLEYKRALSTTQEAYNKIKNKVSYIVGKYKPTESGCQSDFFNLTKICNKCDSTCKRKIAAWERGKYPKEIVGPFEFGEYQELEGSKQNKKDINKYKADEYEGGIESNDMLLYENKTPLEIFKANNDKISYCKSYKTMTRIYNNLQKEKKKEKEDRFWRPLTFYIYGPGGSGKDDYTGQDVVLLGEFYTKIDWNEMINLLNNTSHRVEIKHKGFEPFIAKYIFLTANEAYNFGKRHDDEESVQRDFGQFERRLNYIIEFKGKYNHDIEKRTTEIIFHKGDENKFREIIWDVEYCISEDGIEKTIEESKNLNQDIEGEHIIDSDNLYWYKKFLQYKKNYLYNFSKSRKMFHYKQEFLNSLQNNIIETEDLMIEASSSSKRKLEECNSNKK
ncbi:hypothetical protein F8M41_001759 [Gigaspora margarita]|uniref:Uncharacterized protein n=1 Tax=Gigaspora margarita TaxID=4874 RepID=A0A8H3XDW0_GIGMA|nr:hypothetical protein F8M41_001759 [Gigaspora margarita]